MSDPVQLLLAGFEKLPVTARILEHLEDGMQRRAGGLWGASAALLMAVLVGRWRGTVLVVTADDVESLQLHHDLLALGTRSLVLPRQEKDADGMPDPLTSGERARALAAVAEQKLPLVASIEALLQPAPTPSGMRRGRVELVAGQQGLRSQLLAQAQAAGLRSVPLVLAPGELSARGDVVDVWPVAEACAIRLEFLDETLESIRTFDPASQRTVSVLDRVSVSLGGAGEIQLGPVRKHLAGKLLVCRHEPLRIEERTAFLSAFDSTLQDELAGLTEHLRTRPQLDVSSLPSQDLDYKILSAGSAAGSGEVDPVGRLRSIRGARGRVVLMCRSDEERERIAEILAHKQVDLAAEQVALRTGAISRGFRIPDLHTTVISNVEFAGVQQSAQVRSRPVVPSRAIQSFFELGPGDLVVHAVHGIARFEGTELVERGEAAEDHLRLRFQDDVLLLVPASKIHLVQKYIGSGGSALVDKLGGKGFQRRKEQVQEALFDLASELLEVQAARARVKRPAFAADASEQPFLDAFPFRDTVDQERAWSEIRRDLEADAPMDRLLCGDVGFGKTEVSLRAAFRVAASGRQVAVLVPTTLLAEQHARTFARRCEPFGLRVEMLSRYRTPAERKAVLADLAAGKVDILVGTHQLLSEQVEYRDLGLLVIDEEQRFGVRQKERIKQYRTSVDVLTLSATPIPRTLHGSLLGIRAISTLDTPPPGRQDVETRVVFRDDAVLFEALQRELSRGGQAFVLHNHIRELEPLATRIRKLVPQARVAIGHGQMGEREVERTVRGFVRGEFDVLVCTTIVENGIDIARANTILVDRADMFGMAELHQLRGRVGRSDAKAFCYLMMDHDSPPGDDAKKRLKALEELSHLGAGFAIAMKDLEIRGAGNLLGPEQSGHIAAIGYEMYCQLLRQAVEASAAKKPVAPVVADVDVDLRLKAYLPENFLSDQRQRLELLREMDQATDEERFRQLEQDLADRYGKLPAPVRNLLLVFRLRNELQRLGVLGVQWVEQDRLVVRHPPAQPLGGAWLDAFADVRPVEAGRTHLMLQPLRKGRQRTGEEVLALLLDALSGRVPSRTIPTAWQQGGSSSRR